MRKIIFFSLILLVVLIGLIIYLLQPSIGYQVGQTLSTAPPTLADYEQKQFSGRLFDLQYNSSLEIKEYLAEGDDGLYLEKIILTASQPLSQKLTVNVRKNEEAELASLPDIKKRRLEPDTYTESPLKVAGRDGLLFTRTQGSFEKTLFLPRTTDTVASISLTSSALGQSTQLLTAWQQIVASFVLR